MEIREADAPIRRKNEPTTKKMPAESVRAVGRGVAHRHSRPTGSIPLKVTDSLANLSTVRAWKLPTEGGLIFLTQEEFTGVLEDLMRSCRRGFSKTIAKVQAETEPDSKLIDSIEAELDLAQFEDGWLDRQVHQGESQPLTFFTDKNAVQCEVSGAFKIDI